MNSDFIPFILFTACGILIVTALMMMRREDNKRARQELADPKRHIVVRYTNHRGETAIRRILPRSIRFAATEWHPEPQWILDAWDASKKAERSFALKDMEWLGQA